MSKEPRSVIVKTMVIDKKPADVYGFFSNIKNWETGGALKNIKNENNGFWSADTPFGSAKIRLRHDKEHRIMDHDFFAGGGEWTVFCRVTPNERGSTVSWTFIRPEILSMEQFENQLKNFDKEIEGWKTAILS